MGLMNRINLSIYLIKYFDGIQKELKIMKIYNNDKIHYYGYSHIADFNG